MSGHRRKGAIHRRPIAKGLEVRSMLSIGLDPTWGFGGATQVNDPPTTDVDSVETRKVPIILAPMAGVSTPDMAAAVS